MIKLLKNRLFLVVVFMFFFTGINTLNAQNSTNSSPKIKELIFSGGNTKFIGENILPDKYGLQVHNSSGNNYGLVVRNDGFVGVGTTNPGEKLDVEGSILSGPKGTNPGDGGSIKFEELAASGVNTIGFRAPDTLAADVILTLPVDDGDPSEVLQTDGSGVLSWVAIASAPVTSIHGRTGVVVSANGDYTASEVTNVAAGTVAAVTVQAAINELDTEKTAITR